MTEEDRFLFDWLTGFIPSKFSNEVYETLSKTYSDLLPDPHANLSECERSCVQALHLWHCGGDTTKIIDRLRDARQRSPKSAGIVHALTCAYYDIQDKEAAETTCKCFRDLVGLNAEMLKIADDLSRKINALSDSSSPHATV